MLSLWLLAAACLARPSLPQSLVWPRHQFLPAVTRFGDVYERPIVLMIGWVRGRRLSTCPWLTPASLGGEAPGCLELPTAVSLLFALQLRHLRSLGAASFRWQAGSARLHRQWWGLQ